MLFFRSLFVDSCGALACVRSKAASARWRRLWWANLSGKGRLVLPRTVLELLVFRLQPNASECRAMLGELIERLGGTVQARNAMGVSGVTLRHWLRGSREPSDAGKRVIWLTWALLLHPERCRTLHHMITWGRYATRREPWRIGKGHHAKPARLLPPTDGSDWVI